MTTPVRGITGDADALATLLSPLIRLEIASIGAIEAAAPRETHPGYVMLFQETKTGKQANVEQMNTLLRIADRKQVEGGGLAEPFLHLQTRALQGVSATAMLQAMRLVEEMLVARYRDVVAELRGFERRALEKVHQRATKHFMILVAHVAQRKDAASAHADLLPLPLSSYFAAPTGEVRVCMRCLLDRPGERVALRKEKPHTYVCAACHDEVVADFPADLQLQMGRWSMETYRDRVMHKALGRPEKLRAIKEVHAVLAGLPPDMPRPAATRSDESPPAPKERRWGATQPPSDLVLPREGATPDELAYTDLLFDFRSVRRSW
jgi:hypothetical protein